MTLLLSLVSVIGRRLLAAPFLYIGLGAVRRPGPMAEAAAPMLDRLSGPLHLPKDPEVLVRANGVLWLSAGGLLAASRLPRLAATVLAVSVLPTTWVAHPFWREPDPVLRRQQRAHFVKNIGLLGGTLLAARTGERLDRVARSAGRGES